MLVPTERHATARLGRISQSLLAGTAGALLSAAGAFAAELPEAPMLAEQVAAETLPPVEERLPENPLVVEVVEEIGDYGGTWDNLITGASDDALLITTIGYEGLVRWDPAAETVVPNIAESWEVSEDASEFTFHLREGLKWSDGEPFTARDIEFWWNDVAQHPQLPPPSPAVSAVENPQFEVIDDHTVRFSFGEPHGLFLRLLATVDGLEITNYPAHYLEQFHEDYNPDVVQQAEAAGNASWIEYFLDQSDEWTNSDLPTLNAWVIETPLSDTVQVSFTRNPFYWKVDSEGSQLPYIDDVIFHVTPDPEVALLRVLNGEIDFNARYVNTLQNRPVVVENRERGDYRLFTYFASDFNQMVIFPNLTIEDEVLREVFRNKDFRIGLSHAINRQEIIDLIYVSQGEPFQTSPRPESEFYSEQLAKQYTEYDVDLANQYLDEAGYAERDSEGFRLGPDGERINFVVTIRADRGPMIDVMELVAQDWREVGIDVQNRVVEKSLQRELRNTNTAEMLVDEGEGGLIDGLINPNPWVPVDDNSAYGIAWYYWYTDIEEDLQQEPIPSIEEGFDLYDQMRTTADQEKQAELFRQILQLAADEFYTMGIASVPPGYGIVKNNFRNVPEEIISSFDFADPGLVNPPQFFIEQD